MMKELRILQLLVRIPLPRRHSRKIREKKMQRMLNRRRHVLDSQRGIILSSVVISMLWRESYSIESDQKYGDVKKSEIILDFRLWSYYTYPNV